MTSASMNVMFLTRLVVALEVPVANDPGACDDLDLVEFWLGGA